MYPSALPVTVIHIGTHIPTWTGCWRVHGSGLTASSSALRVTAHPTVTGLASRGPVPQRNRTSQCCQKTKGPHVKKSTKMELNHFLFCGIFSFSYCSWVSCHRYSCCNVSESTQHCFGNNNMTQNYGRMENYKSQGKHQCK